MGGGNAQKSATARARNAEKAAKAAKGGSSQLKANQAAQTVVCATCRQTFMCNSTKAKLMEHVDSKHSKSTFEACFPSFKE